MREILRESFYKNGYLLIIAAWLYTISLIFSNYSFYRSSPERVKNRLETFIKNSEKRFEAFSGDTAVLNSLVTNGVEPEKALRYVDDEVNLYVYVRNDIVNLLLVFWNNYKVIPLTKDLERRDGKYFSGYPNGEFEFIKKTFYLKGKQVIAAALVPIRWNYFF